MIKKILTIAIILILGAACVLAGWFLLKNPTGVPEGTNLLEPEATLAPGITNAEGQIHSENLVQGRITELTEDTVCIKIQNVEWKFSLNDYTKYAIDRLNELGVEIRKGTMVDIEFETGENGQRTATNIMRTEMN